MDVAQAGPRSVSAPREMSRPRRSYLPSSNSSCCTIMADSTSYSAFLTGSADGVFSVSFRSPKKFFSPQLLRTTKFIRLALHFSYRIWCEGISLDVSKVKAGPELRFHIRKSSRSREASSSESLSVSNSPIDEISYLKSPRLETILCSPRAGDSSPDPFLPSTRRRSRKSSSPASTIDNHSGDGNFLFTSPRSLSPFRRKRNSSVTTLETSTFEVGAAAITLFSSSPKNAETFIAPTASDDNPLGLPHEIWVDIIPMLDLRSSGRFVAVVACALLFGVLFPRASNPLSHFAFFLCNVFYGVFSFNSAG